MTASADAMPLVSVVVPCYDAERFIQRTLASVIQQTYPALEIIVVDDGSTDGTAGVVAQFDQVNYHFQPNAGPAAARNAGLQLARGEYIAFLDADDVWLPEMLDACITVLIDNHEVSAVHVNWLPIDQQGIVSGISGGWQPWRGDIFSRLLVHIPFNTSSVVWRRVLWDQIGGFDQTPEINDDWVNWLRIAHRGCLFAAIENPLVYRRFHNDSITRRQSQRIVSWRLNALDRICPDLNVPRELCNRAYAEVHWVATTSALREERDSEAIIHFVQAVTLDPSLLSSRSTYYALANDGETGNPGELDLNRATHTIQRFLGRLFQEPDLPFVLADLKETAYATAWLSLAQMAYASGPAHESEARRYLLRATDACPNLILNRNNLAWLARILVGSRFVSAATSLWQRQPQPFEPQRY